MKKLEYRSLFEKSLNCKRSEKIVNINSLFSENLANDFFKENKIKTLI